MKSPFMLNRLYNYIMSNELYYLHQKKYREISNNKSITHEEEIIHGQKGLIFKYYLRDGNKVDKFVGKYELDGKYRLIYSADNQRHEETITKEQLLTKLSKLKHLKFVYDYIKSQKDITEKSATKRLLKTKRSSK